MSQMLSCTRGHQWSLDLSASGYRCPECGSAAMEGTLELTAGKETDPVQSSTPDTPNPNEILTVAAPTIPPSPSALLHETLVPPSEAGGSTDGPHQTMMTFPGLSSSGPSIKHDTIKVAIPGYEILKELGRGGMGVVYKARHIKSNRLVALKMILAGGHASRGQLERFRIEAHAVASLQHPNIVQVFDVGEHEDRPFFSLEFLEGGCLADHLDGTPWPAPQAAEMVETLSHAMQHAHEKKIVHRDLKPANVLLANAGTGKGAKPQATGAKITDFGLAKQMESQTGQTQSGDVLGTPSYMAPEQAEGKISVIGPATDVYALGAILYELLTGRPPFRGTTMLETLEQVRIQEPVSPRQLHLHAPRDLETICLKCLQKDPSKRYPSAAELAEDLRRFREGEPIKARPVGSVERVYRWCKRNPRIAGLVAALIMVTMAGFVGVSAMWVRAEQQKDRAEKNLRHALDAVDVYFTQVSENNLVNEPGAEGLRRDLLVAARGYYERFVRDNENTPELRSELGKSLYRLAQILAEVESTEEGIKVHQRALGLFQTLAKDEPDQRGHRFDQGLTHHQLGRLNRLASKTEESRDHYQQAVKLWEQLERDAPREVRVKAELARSLQGLGNLDLVKGRHKEAEESYTKALELRKWLVEQDPNNEEHRRDLAVNHDNLAAVLDLLGKTTRADEHAKDARTILEMLVKERPVVARFQDDLARLQFDAGKRLASRGESAAAQTAFKDAATRWKRLGTDRPLVAHYQAKTAAAYHNEGDALLEQGQTEEAAKRFEQALNIKEKLIEKKPDDPEHQFALALAYRRQSDQERDQGNLAKAKEGYLKERKLLDRLAKDHPEVVEYQSERVAVCFCLGRLFQEDKKSEEAEGEYREGLKLFEKLSASGKSTPDLIHAGALCRSRLADLDRPRKVGEAQQGYTSALDTLEGLLKAKKLRPAALKGDLRNAAWGLALTLEQQGEYEKAARAWEKALEMSDEKQKKQILFERAGSRILRANTAQRGKEPAGALAHYTLAIEELTALQRDQYRVPETAASLRNACMGQAQTYTLLCKHDESVKCWNLALEHELVASKDTPPQQSRKGLHYLHWMTARALTEVGDYAESLKRWDRVLELTEEKQRLWYKVYRLETLARSGAHVQSAVEVEALLQAPDSSTVIVGLAGVYALAREAALKGEKRDEAARYTARVMELLMDAEKKGLFKQPANVRRVQQDKAFESLRKRDEYQMLLKRLMAS